MRGHSNKSFTSDHILYGDVGLRKSHSSKAYKHYDKIINKLSTEAQQILHFLYLKKNKSNTAAWYDSVDLLKQTTATPPYSPFRASQYMKSLERKGLVQARTNSSIPRLQWGITQQGMKVAEYL